MFWLVLAGILVTILEFFSLGGHHLPVQVSIPLFTLIIVLIGYGTLWHGFQALIRLNFKSINVLMLIAVCGAYYLGQYEEAAVVIVLYTLAERLEDLGIAKSQSALNALIDQMPKVVYVKGRKEPIPASEVKEGYTILIRPGEMIPLDGEVIKGSSAVDESSITGEPIPKDKNLGDSVFASTLNKQGYLEVRVTKNAKKSVVAKIRQLTLQATKAKAKTQRFIEKFASYYTPSVIFLSLGLMIIPSLVFGQPFDAWFLEALTLLVIACPCALVISTPISIYSAIGSASRQGVLIKGGQYLEALAQTTAFAFDKTRTLTIGEPHVTDVIPFGGHSKEHLLSCAAGIELLSEHPLSDSIIEAAKEENLTPHEVANFVSVPGKGVKADCLICESNHHCLGKLQFILEEHKVPKKVLKKIEALQKEGKTVIVISTDQGVEGVIALTDTIREESPEVIQSLKKGGIKTIMVTGDHRTPANLVAETLGMDEVFSEQLPQDKVKVIAKLLKKYRHVAMAGDGVNDAPSLALASVGVTMSSLGSDTAIEAASMVILNDRLSMIPNMISLAKRCVRIIQYNTSLAVAVKLIFIALAFAGLGSLAFAVFADVGVTIIVILNSLRLLKP